MPSVFISYRRSDSGGHAGKLFDRLRFWYASDELFFDVESIGWGDDFPKKIERAARSVRAVLVVIGPDWLQTINQRANMPQIDFVRREVSIALERRAAGEVKILPILVGGTGMPDINTLHNDLKKEIEKLFEINAYEFPADAQLWDYQFERLQKTLTLVEGIPHPSAQFSYGEGPLLLRFDGIEPMKRPVSVDVQAVRQAFGSVSTALLNWPQEIECQWIERPELDQLYKLISSNHPAVTVVVGEPGGGKSAMLARLGARLLEEGVLLLAIKADQLPRTMATVSDLEEWIGCEVPAATALRSLAVNHRVVVLIDQLDALSELMDQHTERLGSLLRFVDTIRDIQNLSVIVSCREFEFRNDVRLSTLNAGEVSLVRPTWEQVDPLLTARGFETSGWSDEVRDVLRTPQHLAMFLDHLANNEGTPLFTSYQGLLALIVREHLEIAHGSRTVEAAEIIATTMALEEELWLGRARFEVEFGKELQQLEEGGFLIQSETGLSIAFRHQTVFDFLRARRFLRDGQPLAKYIVDQKQQSLFVRPILWSTLNYLRASDRAIYRKQFTGLWNRQDLRSHIRNLLVDFLGQQVNPDDQEAQWLFSRLEVHALRSRVLLSMAGSPGWFRRFQSRLHVFMTAEPERAWEVTAILKGAASFEPNVVLQLVKQFWIGDGEYLPCALAVMREFRLWNESSVDVVCELADHAPEDTYLIQDIAKRIAESRADLAARVVVRYLKAKMSKIDSTRSENRGSVALEDTVSGRIEQVLKAGDGLVLYERLIDNNSSWHGIENLARRAPRAFVEEMWPWLVQLFACLRQNDNPALHRYRNHQGLAFKRETNERQPLQAAMEIAVRGYAETDTEEFLIFLEKNKSNDLRVLHRLLALGLERVARQHPRKVLQYLLEDPRRFSIGDMYNEHGDTQALLSAVVPSLQEEEALRLEKAIREWTWYREIPQEEDATARRDRLKEIRRKRLRLLRLFPFERLSAAGQQYLTEEERALPGTPAVDRRGGGGWIGSPMSSGQMERATDEQVLALFEELTDDTEWDHPTRRWTDSVGGSVQASREFADFASKVPDRALSLIRRFEAGKTERPAGAALVALAKNSADPAELITCIHELDARGFGSVVFRADAAGCLGGVARHSGGLDDETCALLESWISDWVPEADTEDTDGTGSFTRVTTEPDADGKEHQQSLLWDACSGRIVPNGNYPFLDALMWAYLFRKPHAVDQWLEVLERHLGRKENPLVWREITEDLWRLVEADRTRAISFFETFFSLRPEVLHTITGVSLIARVMSWLPNQLIDGVIHDWISGSWHDGPQAAGEILALQLCRNPDDKNARMQVEQILWGDERSASVIDGLRLGVTHTFIVAWFEPALRALTTRYLVQLVATTSIAVEKALSGTFGKVDQLPADDHTRDFLEALLQRPAVLAEGGHFLIETLKGLLRDGWRPDLVHRITSTLISERAKDLGDIRTAWAGNAGDLADIALTLHRILDTRDLGLELFERLMEVRSYGLDERIMAIDRPAFA